MFVSRAANLEDVRLVNAFAAEPSVNFLDINPPDDALEVAMKRAGWTGQTVRILAAEPIKSESWPASVDWVRLLQSARSASDMVSLIGNLPETSLLLMILDKVECPPELEAAIEKRGLKRVLFDGVNHYFVATNKPELARRLCRPVNEGNCAIFAYRLARPQAEALTPAAEDERDQLRAELAAAKAHIARLSAQAHREKLTPQRVLRAVERRLPMRNKNGPPDAKSHQKAQLIEALDLSNAEAIEAWSNLLAKPDPD